MFTHIHHVQLAMPEGMEKVACDFFGAKLGMQQLQKPTVLQGRGGVWFRAGNVELHVGVETPFSPANKAHPALAVESLDAAKARLGLEGIPYEMGEDLPGFKRVFIRDPFGNRIEIVQTTQLKLKGAMRRP